MAAPKISERDGGIVLSVYATPGASRTSWAGMYGDLIRLRVAAPPIEGRANDELRRFVAEFFGVPRRCVDILSGQAGRRKRICVREVDAAAARQRLENEAR